MRKLVRLGRLVVLGLVLVLVTAGDCQPVDGYVAARLSGDASPPTISLSTTGGVTTPDGQSLGDWTVTPTSATPGDTANFQTNVQVALSAVASDPDGGARAVRIFAFLEKTYRMENGVASITQGLHSSLPVVESANKQTVTEGQSVAKTQWTVYLLHDRKPLSGSAGSYSVEYWRIRAEAENYSGLKTQTRWLSFTFDTRRVLG